MTTRWCFECKKQMPKDHEHAAGLFDPVYEIDGSGYTRGIDDRANHVGAHHLDTAQEAGWKALPRSGSFRRRVYDLIAQATASGHHGLTDDEVELATGRSHQSASGARSTLKADGHLHDSGQRRVNRYGNRAIVWTPTQGGTDAEDPVRSAAPGAADRL